jgi:hypothetical protein
MEKFVVKNGHQPKKMRYEEIGLCTQNKDTILGSVDDTMKRGSVINQR